MQSRLDRWFPSRWIALKGFVIVVGVLLALQVIGIAYVFWRSANPEFTSRVSMLLVKRPPGNPQQLQSPNNDEIDRQLQLLQSPDLIQRAIDQHGLAKLKSLESVADPRVAAAAMITIQRMPGTPTSNVPGSVVQVNCRGPIEDDCTTILNAVISLYHDAIKNDQVEAIILHPTQTVRSH